MTDLREHSYRFQYTINALNITQCMSLVYYHACAPKTLFYYLKYRCCVRHKKNKLNCLHHKKAVKTHELM